MEESALFEQVIELLEETKGAHHAAFAEVDGADAEWPAWYAEHMHERLSELLGAGFTRSELVYLLVAAEGERQVDAPGAPWAAYYARFFVERYGSSI